MRRITASALMLAVLAAAFGLWLAKHSRPGLGSPRTQIQVSGMIASNSLVPSRGQATNFASLQQRTASLSQTRTEAGTQGASGPTASPSGRGTINDSSERLVWETNFLVRLRDASERDPIRFPLPGGQTASGNIGRLQRANGAVVSVSGQLTEPEAGRYFFQKQTMPGVAGDFVGVVELPASRRAYRIEPTGPGSASELVERPLGSVICLDLPRPGEGTGTVEKIPPLNPGDFPTLPVPDYQNGVPALESLPGATAVIYLDFQGGYTATWGGIAYERPGFSDVQIRDVWQRVAEDFMPFRINVVTDLKAFESAPGNSRQRVIITPTDAATPRAGGVAYTGSFNWTGDTPCWVFVTNSAAYCAQACSHEAGHTLGLNHTGQNANGTHLEYYSGHGSGETGWAPIMGLGYYRNVSQWSRGEYADADNPLDQLAVITSQNNVLYRADDTGDTAGGSRFLELYEDNTAGGEGVIETTGDTDAFQFTTGGGPVSLRADPLSTGPNLALQVALYDWNDNLLASDNPQSSLGASINTHLLAGTYTFRVTGAGRSDPLTDGFSAYASLGYYSITGSVANARLPNRFVIPENLLNGTTLGIVPANNPNNDVLTYAITSGNSNNTFALDYSGALSVANNTLLDYEALARSTQLPVQFELLVDIFNQTNPALSETNRRVVVAVTNVNEPPAITAMQVPIGAPTFGGGFVFFGGFLSNSASVSIRTWSGTGLQTCLGTNCSFHLSVLEHSPAGSILGTVIGSDPDFHTRLSYSIATGNSDGMFAIDSASGEITIAGDLIAATENVYELNVVVSDQTPPLSLMATATVTVTVELPYQRGSISYAVYTNISGTAVSALTNAPGFPNDPGSERQITLFEGDNAGGDNCGTVARGYLLPPVTGDYTFWISSQDNSELWLSPSTNPASMNLIANISGDDSGTAPREWTKYPSQQSLPISLAAGYAYYIEARGKSGAGTGHVAVAWNYATNVVAPEVIPGPYLAPYFMNYVPHPIGFSVNLHRDAISGIRLGTVAVVDVNSTDTETFTITAGNEAGLFAIDPHTGSLSLVSDGELLATSRTNYTLQVQATDSGTPPLSSTTAVGINIVPTNAIATGAVHQEIWTNIGTGASESILTSQARYPRRPDALRALNGFDSGIGSFGENYGSRIRAYVTPPDTGPYTFFIASDDESQLKFSFSSDPAHAAIIAWVEAATGYQEWTRYNSQQSGAKWLVAGELYYIETLHKQGGGQDHVEVGWSGPGISGTNVIASPYLSPADIEYAPDLTNRIVKLSIMATNGTFVTTLGATDSLLEALTYRILSGNLSNTFAIDPVSGQLTVADNTLLAAFTVTNFSLAIQVQDSGYGGLYPLKSTQATINVQVVDDTPAFAWNGGGGDYNWSTAENWNAGSPKDGSKLTFGGTNRRTNHNNLLQRVGLVKFNAGGFYVDGNPVVLAAGLSSIGDNTWAINSTLDGKQTFANVSRTLTLAGSVNNKGYDLALLVNETLRFDGVLSGTGGLTKSGPGKLVMTAGNSYTGPTVINFGQLVLTNSGVIPSSTNITVAEGAFLDVRGLSNGFTVASNQTLKGRGTVFGAVTVLGTLAPDLPIAIGASTFNALTFSNRVALAGNTIIQVSRSSSSRFASSLRVTDELQCGGRLIVKSSDTAQTLAYGDTFKLFSAARVTGTFASFDLPPLRTGLQWDTSRLAVDGTLRVGVAGPRILPLISGNESITIRFPTAPGLTYVLESTSSLVPPLTWTNVATRTGSGGPGVFVVLVQPATTQRFFRIRVN